MRAARRKVVFPQHHLLPVKGKGPAHKNTAVPSFPSTMDDDFTSPVNPFLVQPPTLRDPLVTASSTLQDATLAECLPLLNGLNQPTENPFDYDERGVKQLERDSHVAFAEDALAPFPAPYVTIDASRPWMIYWALTALYYLGEDTDSFRSRVVKTFFPLHNKTGGYGGGQGHYSHLAGTYATMLSLTLVGGPEAYELTDRQAMWSWLGRLKQPDGGFQICEGGEEDTRAAYCALLAIALLNLPWELPSDSPARTAGLKTFGDGLGQYISRCQTYEGGISSEPGTEAHGAYTYCALAALCLLDAPHISLPRYLDVDALLSWLSSRQYAPEGGFAGRSNKVVDGCYSHWLGDCFPLVQAALTGPVSTDADPDVGDLYSVEGLSRYILNCCQDAGGGLRDKPSKGPDSYHTCYTLAGLSTGEHYHYYTSESASAHDPKKDGARFNSAFSWKSVSHEQREKSTTYANQVEHDDNASGKPVSPLDRHFDSGCRLNAVHPIFGIPYHSVAQIREWSLTQPPLK